MSATAEVYQGLPLGTCLRCNQPGKRIIPAWWLRDPETGEPGGGLCSDCCVKHCEAEDAATKKKRRR